MTVGAVGAVGAAWVALVSSTPSMLSPPSIWTAVPGSEAAGAVMAGAEVAVVSSLLWLVSCSEGPDSAGEKSSFEVSIIGLLLAER